MFPCQFKLGLNTSICWQVNLSFRLHEAICGEKKTFLCRWSCSVISVNSQRKELDMKILLSEAVMPHKKKKSPPALPKLLLTSLRERPLCKLDLVVSYSDNHTLTFGSRANAEVSLAGMMLKVSERHFTCRNSLPNERERGTEAGGQRVRALCKPLAPATEMKVSLNNPVKCSAGAEIPLREVPSVTSTPLLSLSLPAKITIDTWVHIH